MNLKTLLCLGLSPMLLTGCGGGGSSSVIPTAVSLTSWSESADVNTKVSASGLSAESSYTAPAPDYDVTSVTDLGVDTSASAQLTFGGSGEISGITITTENGTVSWGSGADFQVDTGVVAAVSADGEDAALFINPVDLGWDYQTFGTWFTGYGTGSGRAGSISVGVETAGASIPTTGTASFSGLSTGAYVDTAGNAYFTIATTALNADFVTRQVSFSTSDTTTIDLVSGSESLNSSLNLTGTLTYSAGTNVLTSTSLTSNGGMSGSATARFYGPAADEIGGVFTLTGSTSPESYQGAFGAVQ